jgi:hypothetical protein
MDLKRTPKKVKKPAIGSRGEKGIYPTLPVADDPPGHKPGVVQSPSEGKSMRTNMIGL